MRNFAALLLAVAVWLGQGVPAAASTTGSSSATIGFEADPVGPVRPVDPDRPGGVKVPGSDGGLWGPDEEVPQEEVPLEELPELHLPQETTRPGFVARLPGETGSEGWLSFNYVTPLDFTVRLSPRIYALRAARPNLQLSDRRGTAGGWKVTAMAGELRDEHGAAVPGVLWLRDGSLNTGNPLVDPPRVESPVGLGFDGGERRVLTAGPGQGMGSWVLRWYPEHGAHNDLQLELVSEPREDIALEGWVLWVLNDAP